MVSIRDFWRRHRRKILIGAGALGGGYFLYKLYHSYRRRVSDLEREMEERQRYDEMIKAQMQAHFENVQRIADATTLPHAMCFLSERVEEELNLSHLTERLLRGKGEHSTLSPAEKLELWDRLKILSFTKLSVSLWAMTMLTLYIKVLVNILGRNLYIDTAREVGASLLIEDTSLNENDDLQNFLTSADYLSNYSLPTLIADMEAATSEVLKGKQLRDSFDVTALHQTIMQILSKFTSAGSAYHWLAYLMPEHAGSSKQGASSNDDNITSTVTTFNQLMAEAHAVLSGAEFGSVVDISTKAVVDAVVEDIGSQFGGSGLNMGIPLAKRLPQIAKMAPSLLEEPSQNRFVQIIRSTPDVDIFFTLLYTSMPSS